MLLKPTKNNLWRCGPLRVQNEPRRHDRDGGSEPQVSIWSQQNARGEDIVQALERFDTWSAGQALRSSLSKWGAAAIGLGGWGALTMSGTIGNVINGEGRSQMMLGIGVGLMALAVAVWRRADMRADQVEAAIGTMSSWRQKRKNLIEAAQEREELDRQTHPARSIPKRASKRM